MFIILTVKNKQGVNFELVFNKSCIKSITALSKLDGEVDNYQALTAIQTIDDKEFFVQDSFETLQKKLGLV